jgi:hypothetical protein
MTDPASVDLARFPDLRDDIETTVRVLAPAYREADGEAMSFQTKFFRAELAIVYGGVIAVGLAVAAGLAGGQGQETLRDGVLFAEILLTAALGSLAFISRGLRWHQRWLRNRWMAETLRGEQYLFVGRVAEYGEADEPDRVLRRRIVEIEKATRDVGANE